LYYSTYNVHHIQAKRLQRIGRGGDSKERKRKGQVKVKVKKANGDVFAI